ncbi:hypothetical protein BDW_06555 [Bdellovibrio bacteriovorus W]|nr:hypothetical protein BDW_06555 [Bdellovibrio bacteriovorus W]
MKRSLLSAFVLLGLSLNAQAALINADKAGGSLEKVTLSKSATADIEGTSQNLQAVGAGLRAKKVVFVNVKVYVGELFVSSLESFKKADALSSVKDQKAIAIQLHFLRDVDSENVQKSFKEALETNKVNLQDSSVQQFLESVVKGGEAKSGKALTILGIKNSDGSESISYETTSGNVSQIKGSEGFVQNIFSIWLGKPSDDGVATLKKEILK